MIELTLIGQIVILVVTIAFTVQALVSRRRHRRIRKVDRVSIREWGGAVEIRPMTKRQLDDWSRPREVHVHDDTA